MRLCFLLTVLLAGAATAVGGATNTVKATEEISYKATVAKGSISGKIPKGSVLDVVSEEGENLTVRFRQFTTTVPKQSTDYFVPRGDLRTRVAAIFPNPESCLRLVSAILMEISEAWETSKAYLNPTLLK